MQALVGQVVVVQYSDLYEALSEADAAKDAAGYYGTAQGKCFFEDLTVQRAGIFVRRRKVWHGTVGANEILYVPAGARCCSLRCVFCW